ncbi:hypothetical protein [Collimonas pratensis]|uniref:Morphogenetic protein n=1 Tax=Collimonas pratensis TaxID=279113 RepID=A0ABM5Z927_9BURK|nr:hypothetical protein [Collimonas pratensis]AMP15528.1 hypothetical protein CPter291_3291 [Collimonas pratensis]
MKEIPILYNGAMVRALLDDSKGQTRRIINPQPQMVTDGAILPWEGDPAALLPLLQQSKRACPYGQPGDRHWVRETFVAFGHWVTRFSAKKKRDEWHFVDMTIEAGHQYRFDGADPFAARCAGAAPTWHTRPSIFMPRAASRILLDITAVRAERLHDISEHDVKAEGITPDEVRQMWLYGASNDERAAIYRRAAVIPYRYLWESLYGAGSWDANPWVWVVEFRRTSKEMHQ